MNIDRGKTSFTPDETAEVQRRLRDWKSETGFSWSRMEKLTGIPQGTLSVWSGGNYKGDNAAIAEKITRFLAHSEAREELEREAPIVPAFRMTKTAGRIIGALRWAERGKIVVIVGDPGTGKTAALDQYAGTAPLVWKITVSPSKSTANAMLLALTKAMGSGRLSGAGHVLSSTVRERTRDRKAVIIVDEAQHLSPAALEELRAIHDDTGVGVALVGNREVLTRVEGVARTAEFAQLFSRISLRVILGTPKEDDVEVLLGAWGVTHDGERDLLRKIALKPGGGGLRALTFVLEYATVLAQQDQDCERVLDHIKAAAFDLTTRQAA